MRISRKGRKNRKERKKTKWALSLILLLNSLCDLCELCGLGERLTPGLTGSLLAKHLLLYFLRARRPQAILFEKSVTLVAENNRANREYTDHRRVRAPIDRQSTHASV